MTYAAGVRSKFCCGVYEIGDFPGSNSLGSDDQDVFGETPEEFLAKLKEYLRNGVVCHIWFNKCQNFDGTFEKEYCYPELRKAVQKIPGVVHMGKTINPNSGNRIDGYCWINKKD